MFRRHLSIALGLLLVLIVQSVACGQEGTLEWGEITSPALEGNLLGDPATRRFAAYLPRSYETSEKCRYPAFYMLHGFGGSAGSYTGMRYTIDRMIRDGEIGEMIAVFVDGSNRLGGSGYFSSVTVGDYETYITRDLVDHIDAHYRTIPHRNSRGITGFSMGGFGAMHLALKLPDVFGVVVAQAGTYDMRAILEVNVQIFFADAWFANSLPNPDNPPDFFDRPYELVNGDVQIIPELFEKSVEQDPIHDVDRYLNQAVRLNGIKIVHGTADATTPVEQARILDRKLTDLGVDHVYVEHSGGHVFVDEESLGFLSDYLLFVPEETPKVVSATTTLGAIWTGQATPLEIAVVLDAPLKATETLRRMILDLSPLGLPSELPLEHAGDGRYTVSTTITPLRNGHHDLPILVETTEGEQYAFLSVSLVVYPGGDEYLYQDEVEAGWTLRLYKAEANPSSTDYVHSGSCAYGITMQTGGQMDYTVEDPDGLPTFGYTTLEFWINSGSASIQDLNIVAFRQVGTATKTKVLPLVEQLGLSFEPARWQQVSVPLHALELTDADLKRIRFFGDVQGTFYLDDIRFVPEEVEITAVEEVSEGTALPLGYSLSQNVPNPFNPLTAIAHHLPEASHVTLTIYTITGQKVAVLVDAHQEAGHHRVLFNGSGFGTGVYIYRLEAGGFVETRRMVLLK